MILLTAYSKWPSLPQTHALHVLRPLLDDSFQIHKYSALQVIYLKREPQLFFLAPLVLKPALCSSYAKNKCLITTVRELILQV